MNAASFLKNASEFFGGYDNADLDALIEICEELKSEFDKGVEALKEMSGSETTTRIKTEKATVLTTDSSPSDWPVFEDYDCAAIRSFGNAVGDWGCPSGTVSDFSDSELKELANHFSESDDRKQEVLDLI